jgi:hypothetical protein
LLEDVRSLLVLQIIDDTLKSLEVYADEKRGQLDDYEKA